MPAEPEIDFARYAEVSAHLRHFPGDKRDEVLGRLGHRPRAWDAAVSRWTAAREAEIEDGRADLTERFGRLVGRARERLETTRPTLESLGPLPPPEEAAPPAPAAAPTATPDAPLEEAAEPAPVAAPRAALPSFLARPVVVPITPAPLPVLPPVAPPSHLAGTLPLGAALPLPELPFREATPEQALESALSHARRVQGPPEPPRAGMLGGTVAASTVGPASASLPFTAVLPPGCPDLTLPQYASLRVELQLAPAEEATILARYGVGPAARADLDKHWRKRFEADPLARMEFARAYASYMAWMRQQGR